ncbi:MAG TPA: thiosulfate ABC transporter substrate-binding protein CysP [Alphaproteobacteria bacterium]
MSALSLAATLAAGLASAPAFAQVQTTPSPADYKGPNELLNVSYDVARELFVKLNDAFNADWQKKGGKKIDIKMSHAGTGVQARAIIEGLPADVVTFNQLLDVQVLHDKGNLIPADWQKKFANGSSPFYSMPAFLVRKGNPKNVKDWDDLVRPDVKSVFPNPKTSGNARYTYLGAYAFALNKFGGDQAKAQDFVKAFLANVPVFDTGGRASTTTFVDRGIGDVLITFESEVNGVKKEYGDKGYEIVIPAQSILAEFPVAVVDRNVDRKGSRPLATTYLQYLYSPEAQEIEANFSLRVTDPAVIERHKAEYPAVKLVTVDDVFGGWDKANKEHFSEGGILDKVFVNR